MFRFVGFFIFFGFFYFFYFLRGEGTKVNETRGAACAHGWGHAV